MQSPASTSGFLSWVCLACLSLASNDMVALGQTQEQNDSRVQVQTRSDLPDEAKSTDLGNEQVRVWAHQQQLFLQLADEFAGTAAGKVAIPRLCAPVRSVTWAGTETSELQLHPEIDYWEISWKSKPENARTIRIDFDATPVPLSQLQPTSPAADGSILLHACQAETVGEKLRYEPQPYKNTVGYWVNPQDVALWQMEVPQPGVYRIAILQGCGKGQGGSRAAITFEQEKQVLTDLQFDTVDTGHFQNFRWLDLGTVELTKGGTMQLRLKPVEIKRAALLDVRMIHLIRQARP